jgi:hypothetical protein
MPAQVVPGSWADTQPGVAPGLVVSQLQGEVFGCDSYAQVLAALRRHELPRAEAQSLVMVWGQTAVSMMRRARRLPSTGVSMRQPFAPCCGFRL